MLTGVPTATIRRFWSFVDRKGPHECWNWQGRVGLGRYNEYGRFERGLAHRFSWMLHKRSPPSATAYIRHTCESKLCVNPAHLYEAKKFVMSPALAADVRRLYRTGEFSYESLASKFKMPIKRVYEAVQITN